MLESSAMSKKVRRQSSRLSAKPVQRNLSKRLLPYLLLTLVSVGLYGNALRHQFVYDDTLVVAQNRYVTEDGHWREIFGQDIWAFTSNPNLPTRPSNYYRPLQLVIYIAIHRLFGLSPTAFHAANLLVHLMVLFALYLFARRVSSPPVGLAAAILFAFHPVHSEAVVWVSAVVDLACGFLMLVAIHLYVVAREATRWRFWFWAGSLVSFFAALLSKEMALVLPFLLIAYDFLIRQESLRSLLRGALRYAVYFGVLAANLAMRVHALGALAPAQGSSHELTRASFAMSVPVVVAHHIAKLILPIHLSLQYPFQPTTRANLEFFAALVLVVVLVAAIFLLRKTRPVLAYSLAWFFLTLAPALNLTGVGENVLADRYLYIPSMGLALGVGWLWMQLWEWSRARRWTATLTWATAGIVLGLFAFRTVTRNRDWKDDRTLFTKTTQQFPQLALPHGRLGLILNLAGETEKAIEEYRVALKLNPKLAPTYNNLGNALLTQGRYEEAEKAFLEATKLWPDFYGAQLKLAAVRGKLKKFHEAIEVCDAAIRLRSDDPEPYLEKGASFWELGERAGAIASYRKAIELKPDHIEARLRLGSSLSQMQRLAEANLLLREAVRLAPHHPLIHLVHLQLGLIAEAQQDWSEASREYELALRERPGFPPAIERLAAMRAFLATPARKGAPKS